MRPPLLLEVDGMFCTSCSRAVEKVLCRLPGVASARVGFATRVASLVLHDDADEAGVREAAIQKVVALGYPTQPWTYRPAGLREDSTELEYLGMRVAIGVFFGMWVMVAHLALYTSPAAPLDTQLVFARIAAVFATPIVFVVGWKFHLAAWRTVRAGIPGMDLLVSMGAIGAYVLSILHLWRGSPEVWFDAATMLIVLLLAGRLLEARARSTGVNAVRELLDLTPETVRLRTRDGVQEVVAATVEPGAVVEVAAGAQIPLDGIVREGRSALDRSPLTGESELAPVGPGDAVEAGCRNGDGPLAIEVSAAVGERVLDHIATQVRMALDQRAEVPGLAQRLSERAVPLILALSLLSFVGVWFVTGSADLAILRALTVLVVTCPCALGVAAPLVRVVTIGRAATRGILFRDGDALERAGQADVVVFDKTGTLTRGAPRVVGAVTLGTYSLTEIRRLAASAEVGGDHPLARALLDGVDVDLAGDRRVVPGCGVIWEHDGGVVRVGSRDWLGATSTHAWATEVWVEAHGELVGAVHLVDEVRADAVRTVADLRDAGVRLALWSGDASGPVARVAQAVGLEPDEARARMSPLDKAQAVVDLQARGLRVAFVGDGINDAPALASAHVGIAVDGATDAARAAADVVVRARGLSRIGVILGLAAEAHHRSRANLTWALAYNALAVPLALLGWIGPEVAAGAMVLSSISVTLNATRPSRGVRRGHVGVAPCAGVHQRLHPTSI